MIFHWLHHLIAQTQRHKQAHPPPRPHDPKRWQVWGIRRRAPRPEERQPERR
ncbi:MAG: hypothetical protein MUE40_20465 [Anaerolineae bacterium]|jgi:hypothetical protein|nr:hypothetical protein [Anaerolineae bacterium]